MSRDKILAELGSAGEQGELQRYYYYDPQSTRVCGPKQKQQPRARTRTHTGGGRRSCRLVSECCGNIFWAMSALYIQTAWATIPLIDPEHTVCCRPKKAESSSVQTRVQTTPPPESYRKTSLYYYNSGSSTIRIVGGL